uniref:Uncharacterized protein n=1 Tax=Anguilla anguilla TaxID=7936 RepID=A0A0E9RGX0_ANGAN
MSACVCVCHLKTVTVPKKHWVYEDISRKTQLQCALSHTLSISLFTIYRKPKKGIRIHMIM